MSNKKPLSKRTIYTIFTAKFLFSLALIAWTITMTIGAGVGLDDDNTFMSDYHVVDDNYNKIAIKNKIFNRKYDSKLIINGIDIGKLTYNDIFLSQRVIKKRDIRKNILRLSNNTVALSIIDKSTNKIVKNIDANIVFTMPSTHKYDKTIKINYSNIEQTTNIAKKSYWNIMGSIKIGNDEGHFYIKTNTK